MRQVESPADQPAIPEPRRTSSDEVGRDVEVLDANPSSRSRTSRHEERPKPASWAIEHPQRIREILAREIDDQRATRLAAVQQFVGTIVAATDGFRG
jgi:hypothetical protein